MAKHEQLAPRLPGRLHLCTTKGGQAGGRSGQPLVADRCRPGFSLFDTVLATGDNEMKRKFLPYEGKREKDSQRQYEVEKFGIRFLRFSDVEVKQNLDSVLEAIRLWVEAHCAPEVQVEEENKT